MATRRLFLDLDGVLADFDGGARRLLGMDAAIYQERHGKGGFWKALATAPGFYEQLDELPDARELVEAVRPLSPTILTGLPIGKWAEPQKRAWVAAHFPGLPVIATMARDKHRHGAPGDVLVDDSARLAEAWEAMGGMFVIHENAERSLAALRIIFPGLA
ncbi:hypothetical protein ABDK56_03980 [Sphingomonas sp. ASV193]|uniref:5' nucleotidase, NT5C type n=1 Tax=Sphingomonas sp. ASV193 TaxID=3144405 RepID=UPI0032E8AD1D